MRYNLKKFYSTGLSLPWQIWQNLVDWSIRNILVDGVTGLSWKKLRVLATDCLTIGLSIHSPFEILLAFYMILKACRSTSFFAIRCFYNLTFFHRARLFLTEGKWDVVAHAEQLAEADQPLVRLNVQLLHSEQKQKQFNKDTRLSLRLSRIWNSTYSRF